MKDTDVASPEAGTRIFTGQIFRVRDGKGWVFTEQAPEPAPEPVREPARVARMLAFAHSLEAAIESGEYRDRADVARQLGVTRARVSQILGLTLLAPDIQEAILFLEAVDGREPMGERALRDVVRHEDWTEQRAVSPDRAAGRSRRASWSPSHAPRAERKSRRAP